MAKKEKLLRLEKTATPETYAYAPCSGSGYASGEPECDPGGTDPDK